jgi:hypothetical protein
MRSIARLCSRMTFRFVVPTACALAVTASAAACKTAELTWHFDGTVSCGSKRLATKLQSVTAAMVADGGVYLGGYEIDSTNINHPHIAFVPSELKNERYWLRENSIQEFFLWKGRVNVLESSGKAFERLENDWKPSDLQFKPRSVVVATETLVACNPGPLQMTSTERGSCYSPTAGWSVELNWQRVRPAMCNGNLNAIEVLRGVIWARQLQPTDGLELARRKLDKLPSDACSVKFDTSKQ